MKISKSEIFVDFFSPILVALVGAGVSEGGVATTPVPVPVGGGGGVAVEALVREPVGGGGGVPAARVVVGSLSAGGISSHI